MWSFDSETDPGYWVAVESPTDETLRDVAPSANGPVAVGNGGVADGSGHVLPGHMEQDETDWSWSTPVEGGNTIQALTHDDQGYGYAVTNANVYMTTAEEEWTKIGVHRSGSSFYDCTFDEGSSSPAAGTASSTRPTSSPTTTTR